MLVSCHTATWHATAWLGNLWAHAHVSLRSVHAASSPSSGNQTWVEEAWFLLWCVDSVDVDFRLLDCWQNRWIRFKHRLDKGHGILEIWLVAHVPPSQVSNSDLIEVSKVVLALDHLGVQALVDVGFGWSVGEVLRQDNLDGVLSRMINLKLALDYNQVAGLLLPGQLHVLTGGHHCWECLEQLLALLHEEVGILTIVDIREPFLELGVNTWLGLLLLLIIHWLTNVQKFNYN